MSNEPLNIEINALKRFNELSVTQDPTQVARLAGECSEFIFKGVCRRVYDELTEDDDRREPLKFLNDRNEVNFFYKNDSNGKPNSKLIRIQKLSTTIAPLANPVKHIGTSILPIEAKTQKANISEIVVWYFTDIVNYQHLNIEALYKQLLTNAFRLIPSNIPRNLEIVSPNTFQKEIISDEKSLNQLTIDYFLKFNNNPNNLKRAIVNEIYIAPDETFTIKVESEDKQLSANDIISKACVGLPVLMKIMAVGGVGKSTLLWHLIKKLSTDYETFFLRRADPDCVKYIFTELVTSSKTPVLLFLDDVVSYDENRENLVSFGETISEFASVAPIVLFASERFYRYDKFKNKKEFERNFSTKFTLHYSNNSIREQVFEKIFQSLNLNKEIVSADVKNYCKKIFNQHESESLIDSAFNLIANLKKDLPDIDYHFDWDDWNEACTDKFEVFSELFKVVAFFYQFGIQVPIGFLKDYFPGVRNANGLLRELLGTFPGMYSPIVLTTQDDDEEKLTLRHEKLGEWYFKIMRGGENSGKEFFNDFLSKIKLRSASYLFRNLCRKNSDFQFSPYSKQLPNDKILSVIESYLSKIEENEYEEEEYKMLMEKHFVLLTLGKDKEANEPLEKIIQLKPDNVFALTRLASCIQDYDFNRAEGLLKTVLVYKPEDLYSITGLFILYHQYSKFSDFIIIEREVFSFAKENLRFSYVLLRYIERNFKKLPVSTKDELHNLYATHKVLGNDIVDLLMKKGAFNDSFTVLEKLKNEADLLSDRKYRNITINLLIKLYKLQKGTDNKSLNVAGEILKGYYEQDKENPEANFFSAQILSLNKETSDFKQVEALFKNAFEKDKSAHNFFTITRFYREYATYVIGKEKNNLPKAIIVFQKGINHIRDRIKALINNKLPYEIELCNFLNEIVQAYFFHASKLDDSSKKYFNLISSTEEETEALLGKCLAELSKKLPNPSTSSFSNNPIGEDDLQLYSKACKISYNFYSKKIKRISKENNSSVENFQYLTKVKEILLKSLAFDDNPMRIINLIDTKIKLNETDIASTVEKIDFGEFTIKQKARLSRLLIEKDYKDLGIKLIRKFGQLNSTDIKVKNDLAFCYIEAELWSYAIKVFADLKSTDNNTLFLLKELALKLPTNSEERANAKISLSIEYLNRSTSHIRVIKQNICMTFFVTGNKDKSFTYFKDNRSHLDSNVTKNCPTKPAFLILCNEWHSTYINNLSSNIIGRTRTMVRNRKYKKGAILINKILNNILSKDVNLIDIYCSKQNAFYQPVKSAIINLFKCMFTILDRDVSTQLNNYILNSIKGNYDHDSDILRTLGIYYMKKEKFPQAKHCFDLGLTHSENDNQKCFSHNNLADWIMIQIEKKGIESFGNENSIKRKINEAEKHIEKCKELVPTFQYYDTSIERLNALKQKHW